jgi:hypothetical protein
LFLLSSLSLSLLHYIHTAIKRKWYFNSNL